MPLRSNSAIPVLAVALSFAIAPFAVGQGYSRVGSTVDSLDRTLRSGRLIGNAPGGSGGGSSGAAGLGYVNPAQGASQLSRGRGGGGPGEGFRGSRPMSGGGTQFMMPFGGVNHFAPATFTGTFRMSPPLWPNFSGDSTTDILMDDQRIVVDQSYNHRAWRRLAGGSVRDELTNQSLANSTEGELPDLASFAPPKTNTERMATQVNAWHKHHTEAAWQALREGNYRAAHDGFDNALVLNPQDVRSKAGQILGAAMDEQYHTAVAYLRNLLTYDDDLLSVSCPFADTLVRRQRGEMIVNRVSALAGSTQQNRGFAALHAYLLWLDGRHDAARSIADTIQREDPASPFAVLADRIRAFEPSSDNAGEDSLPPLRALSGASNR